MQVFTNYNIKPTYLCSEALVYFDFLYGDKYHIKSYTEQTIDPDLKLNNITM